MNDELRRWSVLACAVGGALIIAGAFVTLAMVPLMLAFADAAGSGAMGRMMSLFAGGMAAWGIVTGIVVLVAAWRIRKDEAAVHTWGVVAIVAGALSLLSSGGYGVGAAAAIAGGVLAVLAVR